MAAILRDSTVVVAVVVIVVRTRPRAIPLAMITKRNSIYGFPLVSDMGMGLRLAALRAAGAPLSLFLFNIYRTQSHYTERTINKRCLYDRAKLREEHFRPEDSV